MLEIYKIEDLQGKLLISSPTNQEFFKSVLLIVKVLMGNVFCIQINKPFIKSNIRNLADLELIEKMAIPFINGGNKEDIGFLHSSDYCASYSTHIESNIYITHLQQYSHIKHIPKNCIGYYGSFCFSYEEICYFLQKDFWVLTTSDINLIFNEKHANKWNSALLKLGLKPEYIPYHISEEYSTFI